MTEKDTRSVTIQSKEASNVSNQIGNISVTKQLINGNVRLTLENRDEKAESIAISYEEFHKSCIKTLGNFELLGHSQRKVPLPKGFETWKKLDFEVRGENKSVFNAILKKFKAEANVSWRLNQVETTIREWKNELEQSSTANPDLITTLIYGGQAIKERLKGICGDLTPAPNQLELETDINADTRLNEIRDNCNLHVVRFKDGLFYYEEQCEIDDLEQQYNQFIPQFIKDRLFNGVARFLSVEQFPEHLYQCLELVDYEVVPIEIGKTQADARIHDIQASRQTGVAPGTIVEIVLPGLQRKADGEIVQKPVVIRGE